MIQENNGFSSLENKKKKKKVGNDDNKAKR